MGKVVDKLQEIKAWATGDLNLLYGLLPGGQLEGNEFSVGSLNGEAGKSLKYNITTGIWKDFATGEAGADIFDLICAVKKCSLADAVEYVSGEIGLLTDKKTPKPEIKKKQTITELCPAPNGIPGPISVMINKKAYTITKSWAYHDYTGAVLMYDVRVDFTDGTKNVIPMHWAGDGWHNGTIPDNRPLYNLHKIPEAKRLIIVEGCKTASAVEQYFPNATVVTWQGGSNAVNKTDWTPITNKERVIIIPDADNKISQENGQPLPWDEQPGQKAALQIAEILTAQKNNVFIVNTQTMAGVVDGWDMADALASNWDKQRVLEFINKNIKAYKLTSDTPTNLDDFKFDYGTKTEAKEEETTKGFECEYYKILGRAGKCYYIYVKTAKAVIGYTPRELASHGSLLEIAPLEYWEQTFGEETKRGTIVHWDEITNHLIYQTQIAGMYNIQAVRGRGAWKDQDRTIINVGNSLIVIRPNEAPTLIETHALDTKFVYETKPRISISLRNPLPDKFAAKLIECCRMVRWKNQLFGDILAGWIFASFVGGILPMRSHLYISGAKESGKSWVIKNIVNRIFGDYKLSVGGVSTEAGIRNALGTDCFPVIFDESEAEDMMDKERMQRIFNLARLAATNEGNNVAKGAGSSGEAILYSIRSSFLFASINPSMSRDADISRTIKITIKDPPLGDATIAEKKADTEKFLKLERAVNTLLTPEYCQALFSRAIMLCDNIEKSVKVISDQAALVAGSKRFGDQMGMIIAGIWHLSTQAVIDEASAREMIEKYKITKTRETVHYTTTEVIEWLSTAEVSYNEDGTKRTYKLCEVLELLTNKSTEFAVANARKKAEKSLLMQGIKVDLNSGTLWLATNKGLTPSLLYRGSIWGEAGWADALLRIEGAKQSNGFISFGRFSKSLAIGVPLTLQDITKEE